MSKEKDQLSSSDGEDGKGLAGLFKLPTPETSSDETSSDESTLDQKKTGNSVQVNGKRKMTAAFGKHHDLEDHAKGVSRPLKRNMSKIDYNRYISEAQRGGAKVLPTPKKNKSKSKSKTNKHKKQPKKTKSAFTEHSWRCSAAANKSRSKQKPQLKKADSDSDDEIVITKVVKSPPTDSESASVKPKTGSTFEETLAQQDPMQRRFQVTSVHDVIVIVKAVVDPLVKQIEALQESNGTQAAVIASLGDRMIASFKEDLKNATTELKRHTTLKTNAGSDKSPIVAEKSLNERLTAQDGVLDELLKRMDRLEIQRINQNREMAFIKQCLKALASKCPDHNNKKAGSPASASTMSTTTTTTTNPGSATSVSTNPSNRTDTISFSSNGTTGSAQGIMRSNPSEAPYSAKGTSHARARAFAEARLTKHLHQTHTEVRRSVGTIAIPSVQQQVDRQIQRQPGVNFSPSPNNWAIQRTTVRFQDRFQATRDSSSSPPEGTNSAGASNWLRMPPDEDDKDTEDQVQQFREV